PLFEDRRRHDDRNREIEIRGGDAKAIAARVKEHVAQHGERRSGRYRAGHEPESTTECRGRDGRFHGRSRSGGCVITRLNEYDLQSLDISRRCSGGDTGDNPKSDLTAAPEAPPACAQVASVVHQQRTGSRVAHFVHMASQVPRTGLSTVVQLLADRAHLTLESDV